MTDAYTTSTLNSVQDAYDRVSRYALRPELYAHRLFTVKPTKQSAPGDVVKFTIYNDLSAATASLDESTDVDAVAISDNHVTVTLAEKGNAAVTTAKLRGTSYLQVQADVANIVGFNAGLSFDEIEMAVLNGGSNVRYAGNATARNTVGPDDLLDAHDVRRALAELRAANVQAFDGGYYVSLIHPDVAIDLREEVGAASWRDPHTYSQPAQIWQGEVGVFEGIRFIETPRAGKLADAGSSTTLTDVYQTIFAGRECAAMAWSSSESAEMPQVRIGPVVDKLSRFRTIGWYWLGGHGRFREAALRRVESASSIGTNS